MTRLRASLCGEFEKRRGEDVREVMAHYLDPNVLDPSLRGGEMAYAGEYGVAHEGSEQHAESSMAAGSRRRSKRTRDHHEPVRGEERNLFGIGRDSETVCALARPLTAH